MRMFGTCLYSDDGTEDLLDSLLSEYDFTEADRMIQDIFPDGKNGVEELIRGMIMGEIPINPMDVLNKGIETMILEFSRRKELFLIILLCGLMAALCKNLANLYGNQQVADMGQYIILALLGSYLLAAFLDIEQMVENSLTVLLNFLQTLLPAYFITTGVAIGSNTAAGLYQVELVGIYLMEMVLKLWLLPLTGAVFILTLITGVIGYDSLDQLLKLFHRIVPWILKGCITLIGGFGMIQAIFAPVLDGVRYSTAQKILSAIPGIGNVTDSTMKMISGSLMLIKNSLGIVILIIMVGICLIPLVKIMGIILILRLGAALIGLIADPAPVKLVDRVAACCMEMFKILSCAFVLNFVVVAIAAACKGV